MSSARLFAVTSGWDGPFQLAEVLVIGSDDETAVAHAEQAFAAAGQPVCRARMRIATIGSASEGVVAPPRTADEAYPREWRDPSLRCDPE